MKKYLKFLSIFSLIILSSCQNNVDNNVKHASFFPTYLGYFSGYLFGFGMNVIKQEEIINKLNFIDDLDFKKVEREDIGEYYDAVWFIYPSLQSMYELGLTIDNSIFYVEENREETKYYLAKLNDFKSEEIISYLEKNGAYLDVSMLLLGYPIPNILF